MQFAILFHISQRPYYYLGVVSDVAAGGQDCIAEAGQGKVRLSLHRGPQALLITKLQASRRGGIEVGYRVALRCERDLL